MVEIANILNSSNIIFCTNAPLFCRDHTPHIVDDLQIFVPERNVITFINNRYAKIKITGTDDP